MSQSVRCHVCISGIVQGVCYRMETRRAAINFGVTGWVKNCTNGTVEGVFEGDQAAVDQLINWCYVGPRHARVSNIEKKWESYSGEYQSFEIVY